MAEHNIAEKQPSSIWACNLCSSDDEYSKLLDKINWKLVLPGVPTQAIIPWKGGVTQNRLPVGDVSDEGYVQEVDAFAKEYEQYLTSVKFGRNLIYSPVTSSTMDIIQGLIPHVTTDIGLVAAAGLQTHGRGRSGSKWTSPRGCAMFSLHVRISRNTQLFTHRALLQHLTALSIVKAIDKQISSITNKAMNLAIKWPNDIYHDSSKVGGILVLTEELGDYVHTNIGIGINVSNCHPTVCLNSIMEEKGIDVTWSVPFVMAHIINEIEKTFTSAEEDLQNILNEYHQRWMHRNKEVRLWTGEQGTIQGVDHRGYLSIQTTDGRILFIEPHSHSLNLETNFIHPKTTA